MTYSLESGNSMRCDRCGKEITGHFFELEGYLWEEHAQSELEMILCGSCYNNEVKSRSKNYRKGYRFLTDTLLTRNSCQIQTHRKGEGLLGELKVQNVKQNDPCSCGSGKKFKECCGKPDLPAF